VWTACEKAVTKTANHSLRSVYCDLNEPRKHPGLWIVLIDSGLWPVFQFPRAAGKWDPMGKANTGSSSLTNKDASIALGMIVRGDREQDIAAWFGVNQARIAEAKSGALAPYPQLRQTNSLPRGRPVSKDEGYARR
jgi:hypothetical protein